MNEHSYNINLNWFDRELVDLAENFEIPLSVLQHFEIFTLRDMYYFYEKNNNTWRHQKASKVSRSNPRSFIDIRHNKKR